MTESPIAAPNMVVSLLGTDFRLKFRLYGSKMELKELKELKGFFQSRQNCVDKSNALTYNQNIFC